MSLKLITGPASEPVSLAEAKAQLRVDASDDDLLITSLVSAAREHVEMVTRRALFTQTWEVRFDAWPATPFRLPLAPLQSVASIKYLDEAGSEFTVATSVYGVDINSEPGRVYLKPNQNWPSAALYPYEAVRIQFVAGWSTTAAVPATIRAALLLAVGHLYENREQVIVASGLSAVNLPMGFYDLLAGWRVWEF